MKFADLAELQEGAYVVLEKGSERVTATFVSADKCPVGKSVLAQLDDGRFRRYRPCHVIEITGIIREVQNDDAHAEVDKPFADFIRKVEKKNGSQ